MADDMDETRRIFLLRALAAGLFAASPLARADLLGNVPHELPAGKSIYSCKAACASTGNLPPPTPSSAATTRWLPAPAARRFLWSARMPSSCARQRVAAFQRQLAGRRAQTRHRRIALGVRQKPHHLKTPTATVGIRGTGLYVESQPDLTYVCTCYGTRISARPLTPAKPRP